MKNFVIEPQEIQHRGEINYLIQEEYRPVYLEGNKRH